MAGDINLLINIEEVMEQMREGTANPFPTLQNWIMKLMEQENKDILQVLSIYNKKSVELFSIHN